MRIVIAGSGRLGIALLEPLLASAHEVVGIVQDGRKTRRARRLLTFLARILGSRNSMPGRARRLGLPIVWIDRMSAEELAPLRELDPDVLLVGGFGIILKPPLLELPKIGCVNTHSSLLPKHRGPNPFCGVILAGEEESGVTFHVMDPGIDTGVILDQTAFPVFDEDHQFSVYQRACGVARDRVVAVMDRIAREGLQGMPQDPEAGSYDKRPAIRDSWIDWSLPAKTIMRQVRALSPSPMARFLHQGRAVRVARAHLDDRDSEAAPGTVLQNRPQVTVAAGRGCVTLRVAYVGRPIPWLWPPPWGRPAVGENLTARKETPDGD